MSTTLHTNSTNGALLMLGRIFASVIFLIAGWGRRVAMAGTTAHLTRFGFLLPAIIHWVIGAIVLALWCLATAAIAHTTVPETAQQLAFMTNLAIAGGFLAFAAGGGGTCRLARTVGRRRADFQ